MLEIFNTIMMIVGYLLVAKLALFYICKSDTDQNIDYFETTRVYENASCFWYRTIKYKKLPFNRKKILQTWDLHSFEKTYEVMQEEHFGADNLIDWRIDFEGEKCSIA